MWRIGLILLLLGTSVHAENYILQGDQSSRIYYKMVQKVTPSAGTRKLTLSYVIPVDFNSPTYQQVIKKINFQFTPQPDNRTEITDQRQNRIIKVVWKRATRINTTIEIVAENRVKLQPLKVKGDFPPLNLPAETNPYLQTSEQVPLDHKEIKTKALELTADTKTEFDAVQKILTWTINHLRYVLKPQKFGAVYAFKNKKGNCQNYSHLAAALMRSVGIPVRIVNGIALKKPYDIKLGKNILTIKMAQGRHSWIEVYFPEMGWLAFDPQNSELFVSNRFIRVEVGLDNNETRQDGLIRWTQKKGASPPVFTETIRADFNQDQVILTGKKTQYGPREILLSPQVEASFTKIIIKPDLPPAIKPVDLDQLKFSIPYIFGNLEFPRKIDFITAHTDVSIKDGIKGMRSNFLVETAEYVTTRGIQYAQTFILKHPMLVQEIGLALHCFNTSGQLWLELFKDDQGQPGEYLAATNILRLNRLPFQSGYDWVDFNLADLALGPGRYWIALGFTDGPIVNWFFSYGKPIGPSDGTRYKKIFDSSWSRSLNFEFNYRIKGLKTK